MWWKKFIENTRLKKLRKKTGTDGNGFDSWLCRRNKNVRDCNIVSNIVPFSAINNVSIQNKHLRHSHDQNLFFSDIFIKFNTIVMWLSSFLRCFEPFLKLKIAVLKSCNLKLKVICAFTRSIDKICFLFNASFSCFSSKDYKIHLNKSIE